MYDQNDISQSSKRSEAPRGRGDGGLVPPVAASAGSSDSLPTGRLVTNGRKVWVVDENGRPLGIFTKTHVTLV